MSETQIATPEAESSEDDLRATLEKAFEQHTEEPQNETVETQTEEKAKPERDETGQFKAKETQAQETIAAEATEQVSTKFDAPTSWKPEVRGEWDKIPPILQKYIIDREAEVHKGFTKFDEERTFGKQLKEVITPYMPIIQAEGGNPITAVQSLLNTAYRLRNSNPQQKAQLFSALAQQYGVDLQGVAQAQSYIDPNVASLQQRIDQMENEARQREQYAQQQQVQAMQSEIDRFSADKPHFETLRPMIASYLKEGHAQDLQTAYDLAFRAHPATAQEWLKTELAKNAPSQATQGKASAARSAAVSVSGAPGGNSNVNVPAATLREELQRQFAQFGAI